MKFLLGVAKGDESAAREVLQASMIKLTQAI